MPLKKAKPYPSRKRKVQRPPWDDTVHDLSVYKLSPEELEARRQLFESKNLVNTAELAKQPRTLTETLSIDLIMCTASEHRSSEPQRQGHRHLNTTPRKEALIASILNSNDESLSEVLRGEHASSRGLLEEFLADDQMKFRATPSVTQAPTDQDPTHRDASRPVSATQLGVEGETVQWAKNVLGLLSQDSSPASSRRAHHRYGGSSGRVMSDSFEDDLLDDHDAFAKAEQHNQPPSILRSSKAHESSHEPRQQSPPPSRQLQGDQLEQLKEVVGSLTESTQQYELTTGRAVYAPPAGSKGTFSGQAEVLIECCSRLVGYLTECETQLHADVAIRHKLVQRVDAQTQRSSQLNQELKTLTEELQEVRSLHKKQLDAQEKRLAALEAAVKPSLLPPPGASVPIQPEPRGMHHFAQPQVAPHGYNPYLAGHDTSAMMPPAYPVSPPRGVNAIYPPSSSASPRSLQAQLAAAERSLRELRIPISVKPEERF